MFNIHNIKRSKNEDNILDYNIELSHILLSYTETDYCKYHVYKYEGFNFALDVDGSCNCSVVAVVSNLMQSEDIDENLLKFCVLYDRLFDNYLLTYGNITLHRKIKDGYKYNRFYQSSIYTNDGVKIIPIYNVSKYQHPRDLVEDLKIDLEIINENTENVNKGKRAAILHLIRVLTSNIDSNNEIDLDKIYVYLSMIVDINTKSRK